MSFTFEKLKLNGLILITPQIFEDDRGWFCEIYKREDFDQNDIIDSFLQENHSKSKQNVLRGLHFQKKPYSQAKLVRCIKGEILDVAVDIDPNSFTFKQWISVVLSADNRKMLFLPDTYAHGFLTLSEEAEIIYKCSTKYNKEFDAGIRWDDPDLNIEWEIENPILSEKDQKIPFFKEIF